MGFFNRKKKSDEKLTKTKEGFFKKIVKAIAGKKIDDDTIEFIEETLLQADVSYETVEKIIKNLEESKEHDKLQTLKETILELLEDESSKMKESEKKPTIIVMVGVNGTGKTTSIAKLAKYLKDQRKSVVVGAGDTFRAAAIEQIKEWGERIGFNVISHQIGSDAAAVVFDTISSAISRNIDYAIIDTAGRLQNKKNLMNELAKIDRIIKKLKPEGADEYLIVIDATTGKNALIQSKIFKEYVPVTGVIVTKLDGTAKGGIALSIKDELGLPIKFIGYGEKPEDFAEFDPKEYMEGLLG
jgi:fused signal recognition particle receptor